MSARKQAIAGHFDRAALGVDDWRRRNRFYHEDQIAHCRYVVGTGKKVLVLGSGTGDLLHSLQPSIGVGVDLSQALVEVARRKYPELTFVCGDAEQLEGLGEQTFDFIILSEMVGYLDDVQHCFEGLRRFCHRRTRVVISYFNFLWQPLLRLGEKIRLKMPTPEQSWLSVRDLCNLLYLSGFEAVRTDRRLLFPKSLPILGWLLNHLGNLPVFSHACLSQYVVARLAPDDEEQSAAVTVVIPCRNERGNIEAAIERLPSFGASQEVLFVDGNSDDGTRDEIRRVAALHPDRSIRLLEQRGTGKGDAVRQGFDAATGDLLMILDADLTVPPEDLPKFYAAAASGRGEFLNGGRLIYPMEDEAMQTLNLFANKFFAAAFSWLLGQPLKDTLCGTKVLWRDDYAAIAASRAYFGDFDPFGDFDLLFGASKLNLKILEVPVRYRRREYGETKIRRFRHGFLLMRMVMHAYRKLKSV